VARGEVTQEEEEEAASGEPGFEEEVEEMMHQLAAPDAAEGGALAAQVPHRHPHKKDDIPTKRTVRIRMWPLHRHVRATDLVGSPSCTGTPSPGC
jgi:hypothetical protein